MEQRFFGRSGFQEGIYLRKLRRQGVRAYQKKLHPETLKRDCLPVLRLQYEAYSKQGSSFACRPCYLSSSVKGVEGRQMIWANNSFKMKLTHILKLEQFVLIWALISWCTKNFCIRNANILITELWPKLKAFVTVQWMIIGSALKIEVVMPMRLTSCDSRTGAAGVTCVSRCPENTRPITRPTLERNQTWMMPVRRD